MLADFGTTLLRLAQLNQWKVDETDNGFTVGVPVRNLVKVVRVRLCEDPETGELWARYEATAGPAGVLDPEFCLRLNGEDRFLAGSVAQRNNQLLFVDSQLVEDADENEVLKSIRSVARYSMALQALIQQAREGRGTGRLVRSEKLRRGSSQLEIPQVKLDPEDETGGAAGQ